MLNFFDHVYGALSVRIHRYLKKLRNSADISLINSNLFVGGTSDVENIAKEGIQSIVDLRKESCDDKHMIKKYSINYLQIMIADRDVPSIEETQNVVNWIETQIIEKRKVFVHCNLGRGRGPLLIVLYLISKGMNSKLAINSVKEKRSFTYLNKKQRNFIREFQNYKNKID
jgi:protein-tyrosine phosphatase